MTKQYQQLSPRYTAFIKQQKLFFVGTAAATGKVNISPKGGDSLWVLNPKQVLWLNATGSGNETSAHVQQLPRMTLMFCAFESAPVILRLYGTAKVVHKADPQWQGYMAMFPANIAARQLYFQVFDDINSMMHGVMALAQTMALHSPLAVYSCKEIINYGLNHSTDDALKYQATWQAGMLQPEVDMMESMMSKGQKRDPV